MARDKNSNPHPTARITPAELENTEFDPGNLAMPDGAKDDRIRALESEVNALRSDKSKDNMIAELGKAAERDQVEVKKVREQNEALRKELDEMLRAHGELMKWRKSMTFAVRKVASAILTPASDKDYGAARNNAIRDSLAGLVDVLTPEE